MIHTFDWQKEDHALGGNSSFLGWLLPHLLVFTESGTMDKVSDKSDAFTNVEVGITINGEPVDAKAFIENLENVITNQTAHEVRESLTHLEALTGLDDEIARLGTVIRRAADDAADRLGITLSSWD